MTFLNTLFNELNNKYVSYCVWGNHDCLPNSLNGSDLDIVVEHKHKTHFFKILLQSLIQHQGKIVSYYKTANSEFFRILGITDKHYWGITIDIFYDELYYKGKIYIPSKWVSHFTILSNGIRVNDIGFSYLAGFLKELLHNKRVRDKYLSNAILELNTNYKKYESYIIEVYGENVYHFLIQNPNKFFEEKQLLGLRKKMIQGLKINSLNVFLYNLTLLNRLKGKTPGYVIAFLGTDGAGKSTIINNILNSPLKDAFHNSLYYEHLRPNKLPSIASLFGKETFPSGPNTNPHAKESSIFFVSLIRWSYYLIDYTFGFYLKVLKMISFRSCIWIFDRYYYDYLIDPKRCRVNLPKWIINIGVWLVPKPDIIFCLGADPYTIYTRKPELPLIEVTRQVEELKKFHIQHENSIWVDTGIGIDESVHIVMKAIEASCFDRFNHINSTIP